LTRTSSVSAGLTYFRSWAETPPEKAIIPVKKVKKIKVLIIIGLLGFIPL
jgi:sporulation protein YlmC with PRC-barrel domain